MAFNPLAGIQGAVKFTATAYAFGKWKATIKNKLGDVSNFTGGGYEQWIAGLTGAKITLEGPYDEGNMPITVGNSYSLVLQFTSTGPITLSLTALCETIEPSVDVQNPQGITATFQSTGSFTAAIA
jgi:hypothetical protein